MMLEQDIFKCSNCSYEMDENYIGCPKCKAFGTIKFLKRVEIGPCQCADCVEKDKQRAKHFNHPFYFEARDIWTKHQRTQIEKGAEKYPEPFTPSSWSNEELVEHAIQENVDQLHYIVGMKERMEQQEKEIERLNKENENQLHYINSARKDYTKSIETIDKLQAEIRALKAEYTSKHNEYEFLFQKTGKQQKKIIELNRKELALDAMEDRINAAYRAGKINGATFEVLMNRKLGEID